MCGRHRRVLLLREYTITVATRAPGEEESPPCVKLAGLSRSRRCSQAHSLKGTASPDYSLTFWFCLEEHVFGPSSPAMPPLKPVCVQLNARLVFISHLGLGLDAGCSDTPVRPVGVWKMTNLTSFNGHTNMDLVLNTRAMLWSCSRKFHTFVPKKSHNIYRACSTNSYTDMPIRARWF